VYSWIS